MAKSHYKKREIESLILLAQKGDSKALEEIVKKVQKDIFAMFSHLCSRKDDISDLTQEALLKMAKSINTLKNPKAFKSWLNQIITNIFYDHARKNPESQGEQQDHFSNRGKWSP